MDSFALAQADSTKRMKSNVRHQPFLRQNLAIAADKVAKEAFTKQVVF